MTSPAVPVDPLESIGPRIDYLQGRWAVAGDPLAVPGWTSTWAQTARLVRVTSIGTIDKSRPAEVAPQAQAPSPAAGREGRLTQSLPRSASMLAGLHGRAGLAFQLVRIGAGVRVYLGVWSAQPNQPAIVRRLETLASLLRGCYPDIEMADVSTDPAAVSGDGPADILGFATRAGYVTGVPDPAPPTRADPAWPVDRVIRALADSRWAVMILAHPLGEHAWAGMRDGLLAEDRLVQGTGPTSQQPSPAVRSYRELLESALGAMRTAGAVGAWRTGVYLLGDDAGYEQLAAAWTGIFAGPSSAPLPVRVTETGLVRDLARSWALPDAGTPAPPGRFVFPYSAQTILSSYQLAACLHLPEEEHPGYQVRQVPRFDSAVSRATLKNPVALGHVVDHAVVTGTEYAVDSAVLTKHAFVCGVTGAGKTTTVLSLLRAAAERGAGFLVLEPAKTEYRSLMSLPGLEGLRVFTAGDETTAPLRINPLEVPAGTSISTHLDLFRALFTAAFALWSPLPQILEQALHRAYQDRGWDINSNSNPRLGQSGATAGSFPTLGDLEEHAEEVIRASGYDPEATARIRGALLTKLAGLRVGGKGRMLDTESSTPGEFLFDHPAVVELEPLGDEQDKAFLMGLLLIRLVEHRRAQGPAGGLRHLLVVEEAHRLLSQHGQAASRDFDDAAGKAVETFTNLLAEVRAYGQGIVIADQVPSRLVPEVLKNTNLKVVHRLVAEDDRRAVAATMGMDEERSRALVILAAGEAAVFSEGEDAPLLVKINDSEARLRPVSASQLRATSPGPAGASPAGCCSRSSYAVCDTARRPAGDARLRALVARIAVTAATVPAVVPDFVGELRVHCQGLLPSALASDPGGTGWRCLLWRNADYLARRRAAQRQWPYPDMFGYRDQLGELLFALGENDASGIAAAAAGLATLSHRLFRREIDPFPNCASICPDSTCLFRWPLADVLTEPDTAAGLRQALTQEWTAAKEQVKTHCDALGQRILAIPLVGWDAERIAATYQAVDAASACATQLAVATAGGAGQRLYGLIQALADPAGTDPNGEPQA